MVITVSFEPFFNKAGAVMGFILTAQLPVAINKHQKSYLETYLIQEGFRICGNNPANIFSEIENDVARVVFLVNMTTSAMPSSPFNITIPV